MGQEAKLIEAFKEILRRPDQVADGIVTAVDEDAYTCTVELASGMEVEDVQLTALKAVTNALVIIPKLGTTVQILNIGEPDWLVVAVEEPDKIKGNVSTSIEIDCNTITFNGGENAGLVILGQLQDNLNQIKTYLDKLKAATAAGLNAVGVGSSANGPAGASAFNGQMSSASISYKNMENPKIKH